jgi:nucleoside-diphosphate-sugar epimerase
MTFGPIAHPVDNPQQLNESNAKLWEVAAGRPLPEARVPVWIDVRDLAKAHVEALLRPDAGMQRYTPASPDKFSYELVTAILRQHYPQAKGQVIDNDNAKAPDGYSLDWQSVSKDLGVEFHSFEECVTDFFNGLKHMGMTPWAS